MEIWTKAEWHSGLCELDQVGSPKLEPQAQGPMDLADATAQAFNKLGADAFFQWAERNPATFFDMCAKHGLGQLAKQKPKEVKPTLDTLDDASMSVLPITQLVAVLLHSMGITTKTQLLTAIADSKVVADLLVATNTRVRTY